MLTTLFFFYLFQKQRAEIQSAPSYTAPFEMDPSESAPE